jgi:hypothetical protein
MIETTQLFALAGAGQADDALEVLAAATGEEELQSAQVLESALTGSTYLVVVRVEATVTVVVSSSEVQSAHVEVEAGSTGVLVDQSAQVS